MPQPNVLVIDRDRAVRKLIKQELELAGYKVWSTESAEEALNLSKDIPFGIVLTDLKFPGVSGIEMIRKFKAANSELSVIAIVPYQSSKMAVDAMGKGDVADYLTKPFNIEELKLVLRRVADRQYLLRQAGQKELYQEMSIIDGLTGVYNRRHLDEILRREIERAKRYSQSVSLLMLDIDNFKKYNDTQGHAAGDELLKKIASLLVDTVRSVDIVFRYGGEEFTVLLPQTLKQGAVEVAKRIVNLVRQGLPATVSVGAAAYPQDAQAMDDLLKKADSALYQAKTTGKDRVCLWGE